MLTEEEQRRNLEKAVAEWPEKTGGDTRSCPLAVLCAQAGISVPLDRDPIKYIPRLEEYYGVPYLLLKRLFRNSQKFWRGGRRSLDQKTMLERFLLPQTQEVRQSSGGLLENLLASPKRAIGSFVHLF